jgi:peptidoglycan/LPS O-acetylase OafA/YrhL
MEANLQSSRPVCWAVLSVWRFFLAWVVMTGHMLWFSNNPERWATLFDAFSGKAAVIGFLLVSGYSIAASLERGESGFYRRRFLRIYALYFAAVLFAVLLGLAVGGHIKLPNRTLDSFGWVSSLGNFLLLQTFLVKPIPFDGPVWSLSIEVAFYILAPFLARLGRPYRYALVAFSMVCFMLPKHDDWGLVYFAFSKFNALNYLWCWVLGFLLWSDRGAAMHAFLLAGAAIVLFGSVTPEHLAVSTYALSALLLLNARHFTVSTRLQAIGDYLGDVSYPLYLFHLPSFIFAYHGPLHLPRLQQGAYNALRGPWEAALASACHRLTFGGLFAPGETVEGGRLAASSACPTC